MRLNLSPMMIVAIAVFVGASIDAAVKHVANDISVVTLMAWRFLFAGMIILAFYVCLSKPMPRAEAIRFHALRGAFQTFAAIAFFWAITQLALAEATLIGFMSALMISPIAWAMLGERPSPVAGIAVLLGFSGAVLAVSGATAGAPETGNRIAGIVMCFAAAIAYALILVMMRLRTRQEDTLTIVMFTNVMPGLMLLPYILLTDPIPPLHEVPIYLAFALAGTGVWWLMTTGYARAEAQQLAPLEYTALIWASLYGWVIFTEVPGWRLWMGALIIIAACLLVAFDSRFRTRKETQMPANDLLE